MGEEKRIFLRSRLREMRRKSWWSTPALAAAGDIGWQAVAEAAAAAAMWRVVMLRLISEMGRWVTGSMPLRASFLLSFVFQ